MNTELTGPLHMLIGIANDIYLGTAPKPNSYVGDIPAEFHQMVYKATSNIVCRVPNTDAAEAEAALTQILVDMRDFLLCELYTFQYMPGARILTYEEILTKAFE